jgi:hypothetical protein
MSGMGSIVVDELIIPIVDIHLADGKINFVGRAYGSFPATRARAYTVHGRDGRVIYRTTPGIGGLTWKRVVDGVLYVYAPFEVTGHTADPVK